MQQYRRRVQTPLHANAVEHGFGDAEFDALRCHGCCRIKANPAASFEPHFGPGVRIGLAHDHVVADRIHFAALVAEHNACGNAGCSHHDGKCGCVVLAKTTARFEQKTIYRVSTERRRFKCVIELFVVKAREYGGDVGAVGPGFSAHAFCQIGCALVPAIGQSQVPVTKIRVHIRIRPVVDIGLHLVSDALVDRKISYECLLPAHAGVVQRPAVGNVQRVYPLLSRRLQRDVVSDRFPAHLDLIRRPTASRWLAPGPAATIELVQHETAPVAIARCGYVAVETNSKCDGVGHR